MDGIGVMYGLLIGMVVALTVALLRATFRPPDRKMIDNLLSTVDSHQRQLRAHTVRLNAHETHIDELRTKQKNHTQYQHNGSRRFDG